MKTLGDLLTSFQLYAVCTPCERMERVPIRELAEQLGHDLTIDQTRRRLRCRGCGTRTGDIRIVYVGENAKLAGFHYRGSPGRSNPERGSRERDTIEHGNRGPAGPESGTQTSAGADQSSTQPFNSSVDSSVSPNPSTPT